MLSKLQQLILSCDEHDCRKQQKQNRKSGNGVQSDESAVQFFRCNENHPHA